eukprot:2358207-Amphidinium_carterae.1
MASKLNRAVVADVQEANAIIRYVKSTADRQLIIHATPVEQVHWLAFSDVGGTLTKEAGVLDEHGQPIEATQGAWILFSCAGKPHPGSDHNVTPMMWKSTQLRRKVPSTFAGETLALADAVGALERLQAMWIDLVSNGVTRQDWRESLQGYTVSLPQAGHLAQRTITSDRRQSIIRCTPERGEWVQAGPPCCCGPQYNPGEHGTNRSRDSLGPSRAHVGGPSHESQGVLC